MKIIFIPGLLCTNEVWGECRNLSNVYDVEYILLDSIISIEDFSNQLINNLSEHKEVAVIGISLGGYIAIELAIKRPSWLKKLVLINTTANSVDSNSLQLRLSAIADAENNKFEKVINMAKGMCFYKPKKNWLELERKMAYEIGAKNYIKQQKAIISRKNNQNRLQFIHTNTLIISGKDDQIIPYTDSLKMFETIPEAQIKIFSKCGHLSTIEKSKEVYSEISCFIKN